MERNRICEDMTFPTRYAHPSMPPAGILHYFLPVCVLVVRLVLFSTLPTVPILDLSLSRNRQTEPVIDDGSEHTRIITFGFILSSAPLVRMIHSMPQFFSLPRHTLTLSFHACGCWFCCG